MYIFIRLKAPFGEFFGWLFEVVKKNIAAYAAKKPKKKKL